MAMTEKKRITDYEWKRRNKKTLTCVVFKDDAEKFAAYAAGRGQSVNECLKEFISSCIGPLEKRTGPQKKAPAAPIDQFDNDMPE